MKIDVLGSLVEEFALATTKIVRHCFEYFNGYVEDLCKRKLIVFGNHLRSKNNIFYAYNNEGQMVMVIL